MGRVGLAAVVYFAVVFAVAFGLGVFRVTVLVPRFGALALVALEVPVVLGVSWAVARRMLGRWPMALPARVAMGGIAFLLLMTAEAALAAVLSGQSLADFVAAFATLPGALGLAGQIGFAVIPAMAGGARVRPDGRRTTHRWGRPRR
jgi:hypothetical protein